jgi:putative ABC transport system substrate-binding protein
MVRDPVDVIVAVAPAAALAAKAASASIPIIFSTGADPVDLGLVSSLSRPGGNVTGVSFLVKTLTAKRLELLHELEPRATVFGFLINPANPASQSEIDRSADRGGRNRAQAPGWHRKQRTGDRCGFR